MYIPSLACTFAAVIAISFGMLRQVFLGSLREAEVERINDRISQAIMETCLAMTIFREEFNVEFCAMFTVRSSCHAAAGRPPPPEIPVVHCSRAFVGTRWVESSLKSACPSSQSFGHNLTHPWAGASDR